jgi:AcrR family transcriptional regulator
MSSLVISRVSSSQTPARSPRDPSTPRERILEVAYELFSRAGVRGVGVDEVVDRAGVAKATLYRHFPAKNDLVLAFLELREQRYTRDFIEAETERRASTPEGRLLAIFDLLGEWFSREGFEACSFINVLLELGAEHPAGAASVRHLKNVRAFLERLAREAELRDPSSFACAWHILMKGAIVAAAEGDPRAARCAQDAGRQLLAQHAR